MRRADRRITDTAELESILRQGRVLRLGMCDGDEPYVLPLNYGYSEGVIYMHCAKEGRKLDVLRANPKVCFEVTVDEALCPPKNTEACGFTMRFRCVMGRGVAEIVEDAAGVRRGLEALMEHYAGGGYSFGEKLLSQTAVIRVRVDAISGKQNAMNRECR